MKFMTLIVGLMVLTGCAGQRFSPTTQANAAPFSHVIWTLSDQLMNNNNTVTEKNPIAVTDFVYADAVKSPHWLSATLGHGVAHQLQQNGFTILDHKGMGVIQVTEIGDFARSQDWQQLSRQQNVDYVLAGIVTEHESGVWIQANLLGLRSNLVVASAEAFLSNEDMGDTLGKFETVRLKQGYLVRE